jgi:copper(I)-binding protein
MVERTDQTQGVSWRALTAGAFVVLPTIAACAEPAPASVEVEGVEVRRAWTEPAWLSEAPMYVTLENHAAPDVELIGAMADPCFTVHVHYLHTTDPGTLELPTGERRILSPYGVHLLCIGLNEPFETGDEFDVDLVFDRHPTISVRMKVLEQQARMPDPDPYEPSLHGH